MERTLLPTSYLHRYACITSYRVLERRRVKHLTG
ncbi:hypothetical protein VP424E501_P0235 [Vibrio phage 424E50-1]|nr:hypothetical protein VP424E501_P0235 [Vibrio phage 424E50-1]